MSLVYAGVNLSVPTREALADVEANLSLRDIYGGPGFEDALCWPGKNLTALTFPGYVPLRPLNPQRLFWPRGASRWAVANFIITETDKNAIEAVVFPSAASPPVAANLHMEGQAGAALDTSLFALPPRLLRKWFQTKATIGYYLLTLVDARYYWWYQSGLLTVTEGTTNWSDLYVQLENILGVTIEVDAIDPAYLQPSAKFQTAYEYAPILLDALAYNCGQRIVRRLDGTVLAMNAPTARTSEHGQLDLNWLIQAGGMFALETTP